MNLIWLFVFVIVALVAVWVAIELIPTIRFMHSIRVTESVDARPDGVHTLPLDGVHTPE